MRAILCPRCSHQHQVPAGGPGSKWVCPACQEPITLVVASEETRGKSGPAGAGPGTHPQAQHVGRFELRERLGAGAFGVVYRAHDPLLNRDVAVKLPSAGAFASEQVRARSVREAQAAARLRHANIVPIYEAGFDGDRFFVASALIAGQTLRAAIPDAGLDPRRAADIARKLAGALQSAHVQGIVHRDVKPANVMLDQQGEPQLMDFGLAHLADATAQLTSDGSVLGTPAYMSPEQAGAPLGTVGPASDQYSLGATFYQMLTGRLPFEGQPAVVIYLVRTHSPPAPRSLRPDIPPTLEAICLRAMARRPEDRYGSCADLAQALDEWLHARGPAPTAAIASASAPRAPAVLPAPPPLPQPAPLPPPAPVPVAAYPPVTSASSVMGMTPLPSTAPQPAPMPAVNVPARRSFLAWLGGVGLVGVLIWFCVHIGKLAWQAAAGAGDKLNTPSRRTPAEVIRNSLGMQLVLISASEFQMGSTREELGRHADESQHHVQIAQPFYLGQYEVTQAEFEQLLGRRISYFSAEGQGHEQVAGGDTGRHPVECVSWELATEFCQRLSDLPAELKAGRVYTLPTEAQWEYACRAGTTTPFHYGLAINGHEANINGEGGYGSLGPGPYRKRTLPVGSFEPNAFGLYDMHGNVWEWCQDLYAPYPGGPAVDPTGFATSGLHVLRGGSWTDGASSARCAHRATEQGLLAQAIGFRVVATLGNKAQVSTRPEPNLGPQVSRFRASRQHASLQHASLQTPLTK